MPVVPPKHKEIRLDAVVNNTITQTKNIELKSIPQKDLNYNSKLGEQRIVRASEKRD